MSATLKKQKGLTLISWMIVIAIALFFVMIGIKMVPTYMENYSIRQVLADLEHDRRVREMGRGELKKIILKRFQINGVYNFKRDDLKIAATKDGTEVSIDYEVRKKVIGNVSVLMEFSESVSFRK